MKAYDLIAILAFMFFDGMVCITLVTHYFRLKYKFLGFGAIAIFCEVLKHITGILVQAPDQSKFMENLWVELWFDLTFVSSFSLFLAIRQITQSEIFPYIKTPIFLYVLNRVIIGYSLDELDLLKWTLSYAPILLCQLAVLAYAIKYILSDKRGGFSVFFACLLVLVIRLVTPYFAVDAEWYSLVYILDSFAFAFVCGLLVLTGMEVLHRSYGDSLESQQQVQKELNFVLDNTEDAIITFDDNFSIITWNERAHKMLGFSAEEVVRTMNFLDFVVPEDKDVIGNAIEDAKRDEQDFPSFRIELSLRRRDLNTVQTEISARLHYRKDNIVITAIFSDITLLKEMKAEKDMFAAQVQHTQKLESLGVLAGGIAHDFNNLLACILGYAELVSAYAQSVRIKGDMSKIVLATERAAKLTNQMLTYSGQGTFLAKPMYLTTVVEEVLHLMKVAVHKNVTLNYDLCDQDPSIIGDVSQLGQVVMNLVSNASDALEGTAGNINLSIGESTLSEEYLRKLYFGSELESGAYVFIRVVDTGVGMSQETQQKLFDPFYTTKFTGRGLGMASVAGIVNAHHGAVDIDSSPEKGCCITVFLPASTKKVVEAEGVEKVEIADAKDARILIVEDENSVRELNQNVLLAAGYQVDSCNNGLDGLHKFEASPAAFDLALLDCTMPGLSGQELYFKMREVRPDLPVLFCSGYTEQAMIDLGAMQNVQFTQKPTKADKLKLIIAQMLEK